MKALLPNIINRIAVNKCRYEVYSFESGAVMIDIWVGDKFYVVQLEEKLAGISLITEADPGFDIIPQKVFPEVDSFNLEFEKIFYRNEG